MNMESLSNKKPRPEGEAEAASPQPQKHNAIYLDRRELFSKFHRLDHHELAH
jgi:hypothetical protein